MEDDNSMLLCLHVSPLWFVFLLNKPQNIVVVLEDTYFELFTRMSTYSIINAPGLYLDPLFLILKKIMFFVFVHISFMLVRDDRYIIIDLDVGLGRWLQIYGLLILFFKHWILCDSSNSSTFFSITSQHLLL